MTRARGYLFAAALATAFCAPPSQWCRTLVPEPSPVNDNVQVTFLGVGGLIVRWAGASVMTATLYSNPTIGEIALSEIHTDRQRIDEMMRQDLGSVRAILSGHSHYDHLMEVPYVALHKATTAEVIGNDSMVKLLDPIKGYLGSRKLVSLEGRNPCTPYPVQGTRFQIRAIASQHSPQIGPRLFGWGPRLLGLFINLPAVSLWRGEDEFPARDLPVRAGTWPGGTTQAFIIDLLKTDGTIDFRIYYQDSPTVPPYGYPPTCDGKAVDLAILCMGGATEYPSFPRDIVGYLKPKYVMGIHWEDVFNPRPLPSPAATNVREQIFFIPGVHDSKFRSAVQSAQPSGGRVIVPCPDQVTVFQKAPSGAWDITEGQKAWSKGRS